jgi:hypothetical protein
VRLKWVSGTAFLLACVGGLVFFLREGPGALDTGDKIGSIGSLIFGAASLFVAVVALRSAKGTADDEPAELLDRAAEELARLVDAQWRREAQRRGLLHPGPMRIPWSSTTRPVSAPVSEIVTPMPGIRPTRLHLRGHIGEIADTWRRLPARQLVVIGSPAAGKTTLAVLFVREVLAARAPGEPVPVLLNLAGWDPAATHLDTWIARRLVADYPQLTQKSSYGEEAAVRLVDRWQVIPVLDGLDEMPEVLRPLAITALNQAVAGERPLVVTCRTDEFEETIAASGAPLGRAAVVELAPLRGDGIVDYLPAGQVDGAARWSAVLARLSAEPDGVLAQAMSNPLMTYFARTAYAAADTDPETLLTFDTVTEVEEHLFETYLPTTYRQRPPTTNEEALRPYRAEEVRRWLSFIAGQLHRKGKRNLCLWRLEDIRPEFGKSVGMLLRSWRGWLWVVGGLALLGVVMVATLRVDGAELLGVLPLALLIFFWRKPGASPARVRVRPVRVSLGLVLLIGLGAFFVNANRLLTELASWAQLAMVVPFTVAFLLIGRTIFVGLIDASPSKAVLSPAIALRQDRGAVVALVLTTIGMAFAYVTLVEQTSPEEILGLVGAGLGAGLAASVALGVGVAWANWVTGRAWLAIPGVLPWRLLPFIEDAHRRGVLRAVGTEYQFRHVRLQDYLSRSG